ncbi:hypothetical protein AB832_08235 [Flavobacteriaceae bacterium (ex Bugula neritina AB1)]|nr:hypothetical protein AB832_08235 [Flavobacteriaceae bacterium (ex Bugula neritina AB1)]
MSSIVNNFSYFVDSTGNPLNNGNVYFGEPDRNPSIAIRQIQVFAQQEDGTLVKLPQPIKTNSVGIAVFLGNPIKINVETSLFSIRIEDAQNNLVYTRPRSQFGPPSIANQSGNYLTTDGTTISWADPYPDQTGEASKTLSTDGTNAEWAQLLPDQDGQDGKTLFTDGTDLFWENNLPDQAGQNLKFLTTNGTNASWELPYFNSSSFDTETTINITSSPVVHSFSVTIPPSGSLFAISESTVAIINPGLGNVLVTFTIDVDGESYDAVNASNLGQDNRVTVCGFSGKEITGTPGEVVNFDCTLTVSTFNNVDNVSFTSRVMQG